MVSFTFRYLFSKTYIEKAVSAAGEEYVDFDHVSDNIISSYTAITYSANYYSTELSLL